MQGHVIVNSWNWFVDNKSIYRVNWNKLHTNQNESNRLCAIQILKNCLTHFGYNVATSSNERHCIVCITFMRAVYAFNLIQVEKKNVAVYKIQLLQLFSYSLCFECFTQTRFTHSSRKGSMPYCQQLISNHWFCNIENAFYCDECLLILCIMLNAI